jgi:hypothetical protein
MNAEPSSYFPFARRAISPSFVTAAKWCPRTHSWRYVKKVGIVRDPSEKKTRIGWYNMLVGRMWHKTAQVVDAFGTVSTELAAEAALVRAEPTYLSADSGLVDRAVNECQTAVLPKYLNHLDQHCKSWRTIDLELPISAMFNDIPVKCIPDKVVEEYDKLWVVERKTTQRDDQSWHRQWALNFQTTMEVMIAESHYQRPVEGVIIEQVKITRKRAKNWPEGQPQDISKVEVAAPRPVPKTPFIKAEAKQFLAAVMDELRWRHKTGHQWDANYVNCPKCEMFGICSGRRQPEDALVPLDRGTAL